MRFPEAKSLQNPPSGSVPTLLLNAITWDTLPQSILKKWNKLLAFRMEWMPTRSSPIQLKWKIDNKIYRRYLSSPVESVTTHNSHYWLYCSLYSSTIRMHRTRLILPWIGSHSHPLEWFEAAFPLKQSKKKITFTANEIHNNSNKHFTTHDNGPWRCCFLDKMLGLFQAEYSNCKRLFGFRSRNFR